MTEPVHLNKKKEPVPFEFLLKATNHFYDRILRAMFLTLLFVFDFVMFVYSINGRVMENGVVNEAMLYIAGGFFAVFLVFRCGTKCSLCVSYAVDNNFVSGSICVV